MEALTGYMHGANLGHWLSQYGNQAEPHWDTYITEGDFARMQAWGLDHVRVPVDYMLFEEMPLQYREDRLAYIDRTIAWCRKYRLNMVLDLHHAPGFFFGNGQKNNLFTERVMQERFLAIWRMLAKRYAAEGDNLIFELLNELVWENSDPWNALWQEAVEEILAITPHRRIMVGGNHHNNVGQLKYLAISPHPQVIYTFHFYEPFMFTHQRASWTDCRDFKPQVPYPVPRALVTERYAASPEIPYILRGDGPLDITFVERVLAPALTFMETHNRPLYCGEYGVIRYADDESAARWLDDVAEVLNRYGIGRAVWSYRGFSGITSADNQSFRSALAAAIAR